MATGCNSIDLCHDDAGITTVLTLTTIQLEVRQNFPRVPYPTALDLYLTMCYAFIIGAMIEFTFVHHHTKLGGGDLNGPAPVASPSAAQPRARNLAVRLKLPIIDTSPKSSSASTTTTTNTNVTTTSSSSQQKTPDATAKETGCNIEGSGKRRWKVLQTKLAVQAMLESDSPTAAAVANRPVEKNCRPRSISILQKRPAAAKTNTNTPPNGDSHQQKAAGTELINRKRSTSHSPPPVPIRTPEPQTSSPGPGPWTQRSPSTEIPALLQVISMNADTQQISQNMSNLGSYKIATKKNTCCSIRM